MIVVVDVCVTLAVAVLVVTNPAVVVLETVTGDGVTVPAIDVAVPVIV